MSDQTCIGDGYKDCTVRATWMRQTQFAGDHPFCDAHARAEKDFGANNSTTVWYQIDPETKQQTPYSVKDFIEKARAAGHDALGIANDPEALAALDAAKDAPTSLAAIAKARDLVDTQPIKINHHTRAPNQPNEATIVEGDVGARTLFGALSAFETTDNVHYKVSLVRKGPGNVGFQLWINGHSFGQLPFDNLVKAATRIDPEHAVGTEKQIQQLRREAAEAKAEMYEWQARATLAEERTRVLEENLRAFQEASKA